MPARRAETRNTMDDTSDLGYLGRENDLDEGFVDLGCDTPYERSLETDPYMQRDPDAPGEGMFDMDESPGCIRRPANYGRKYDIRRN